MLIPYVKFHEETQAYAPVRSNIRNRIGMVGEFSRGPANQFTYIGGFSDFARRYGCDTTRGSMAFQAAWDQGAKEFGLVRILGDKKPAQATIRFSGYANKANTIALYLRFVGEAVNRTDRVLRAVVRPSGVPTDDVNGRLWFRVMDIDEEGFARVKFHFLPDGVNNQIDWLHGEPDGVPLIPLPLYPLPQTDPLGYLPSGAYNYFQSALESDQMGVIINPDGIVVNPNISYKIAPEGQLYINIKEDMGSPTPVAMGVNITFGTSSQIANIPLEPGDTWSVRLSSVRFDIPIYEGAVPSQVSTAIIEALQGVDPIGGITRTEQDDGVIIPIMEELEGAIGNRFSYYIYMVEPDGEVICEGTFFAGQTYINVPLKYATYIQQNAYVEMISGNGLYGMANFSNPQDPNSPTPDPILLQAGTKVVKVEAPLWGDMALVWLSKPIVSTFDSIAIFKFMNPTGLSVSCNSWYQMKYMNGGEDGPRRAFRDFYDMTGTPLMRIIATSEGKWGNSLRLNVYPINNERFRLTVRDLNKDNYFPVMEDEVFEVSLKNTDDDGNLTDLFGSNHIQGVFLPKALNPTAYNINLSSRSPMRLAPPDNRMTGTLDHANPLNFGPEYLRNVSMEDGYDGPPLREHDYIKALNILSQYPAHIICCPGVWNSEVVKQNLIAQAHSSDELTGLRIAILNAPPKLIPEASKSVTIGYDSDRAVMIAGWSTYAGQAGAPRYGLSPDALLAGKLGAIQYWISPAARSTSGPVMGITEVDTQPYSSTNQLNVYSGNRLEILALDPALGSFYFMTGQTLSSDTRKHRISVRRSKDVVRMDLYLALQIYKSEPLTALLLSQIASSVDSYMHSKVRNRHIQNYTNSTVTSPSPAEGLVEVTLSFQPIGAADYINVYLFDTIGAASQAAIG